MTLDLAVDLLRRCLSESDPVVRREAIAEFHDVVNDAKDVHDERLLDVLATAQTDLSYYEPRKDWRQDRSLYDDGELEVRLRAILRDLDARDLPPHAHLASLTKASVRSRSMNDGIVGGRTVDNRRVDRPAEGSTVTDPFEDILGDYRAFAAQQRDRLLARGIDIAPYGLSHLAFRVPEWDQYVHVRTLLERHAVSNRENLWNGRPISMIVPARPLEILDGKEVPLIELIPPVHQRVYTMGLEHLGVVVGEEAFDAFVERHKPVLTGQQFQGPNSTPDPVYILMEDFSHVKFYRLSLRASVELFEGEFSPGFHHVEDWVPQRLVTATGPNPLPR